MSKTISLLSALLCTFIWGTTFIAQDTGMEKIGPYVFNSVRFFVGFLVLIPFYLLLEKKTTKEVLRIDSEGFKVYGEFLKSADDVAAAFRHYFYTIGYGLDDKGKIIVDEIQGLESGKEQKDE